MSPQKNKGDTARVGHAVNVRRRLRVFWTANVVRTVVRMVARHLLKAFESSVDVQVS